MDFIADTTFLVGLWRKQAWATRFATEHASATLGIPWVVLGEFWHGAKKAGHDAAEVARFLELGQPVREFEEAILCYAEICVALQSDDPASYQQIGQNDLWIAAVTLASRRPLVTRNQRHFRAIAGLEIIPIQP